MTDVISIYDKYLLALTARDAIPWWMPLKKMSAHIAVARYRKKYSDSIQQWKKGL